MVIHNLDKKEKNFYVEFARWSCVVSASDAEEAATIAFEEVLEKYREKTEVSSVFSVLDITSCMQDMQMEDNLTFVYAPTVLSNAGMHNLSQKLQSLIKELQSKIL